MHPSSPSPENQHQLEFASLPSPGSLAPISPFHGRPTCARSHPCAPGWASAAGGFAQPGSSACLVEKVNQPGGIIVVCSWCVIMSEAACPPNLAPLHGRRESRIRA